MHSVADSLRNDMLNQAALLFIQLLFMWKVSAEVVPTDHRNITVFRGEPVTLNCNTTATNISQINWRKDKLFFAYLTSDKRKVSNLTSDRLQIDIDSHSLSTLKLLNAQPDDAGRYICDVTTKGAIEQIVWSLHVSEEPPEVSAVRIPLYLLICVPVLLLLCVIALTVCLCSHQRWVRATEQDFFSKQNLNYVQFHEHLREEVIPREYQNHVKYKLISQAEGTHT